VNFVADESLDLQIVKRLRQDGHIISYITEIQPGVTDDIVLNLANQEGRVLLTADKDFGELVFRLGRASFGVVLIRLSGLVSSQKAEIVAHAFKQCRAGFACVATGFNPLGLECDLLSIINQKKNFLTNLLT
jgi:predicted nuclease of predicted toxin-antitoxin system